MSHPVTHCPSCSRSLRVSRWHCPDCGIGIDGDFGQPVLGRLSPEHQAFVEVFLECRGVIRDVEAVLGISYPTVRARLDGVVDALAAVRRDASGASGRDRRAILDAVASGRLAPEEAVRILGGASGEREGGDVA